MNKNRIEIGDTVRVRFEHIDMFDGVVEYMPQATGDSWVILDKQGGFPIYVQSFSMMILLEKGND